MPRLLKRSLLGATFILLGLVGVAHAQEATRRIAEVLNPDTAYANWQACKTQDLNDVGAAKSDGKCEVTQGVIRTSCTDVGILPADDAWDCRFTHTGDGSYVTAEKGWFSSTYKWYDSAGNLFSSGDGSTGTGSEAGNNLNSVAESQCSGSNIAQCFYNIPGIIFTGMAYLFLTLAGFILGLAGTVFNWVVIRTVFQFGTYFGTNEGMLIAWGVMRDVANIGLLFGFILMGVLLILNVDGGGHGHGHGGGISAKKAIPRLIIFAVLLNFSLFASQVVIDVANAFSSSFATLAGEQCKTDTSDGTSADEQKQSNEDCANIGISSKIIHVAGLSALWSDEALNTDFMVNIQTRPYSYAVSLIMLSIFVLVTAVVLLAGSIMLVIRVVILSLLMVTSPIGFAGMAIPKMQGIASMWWSKLISQAFFAPVYLLLIFISIKLTEGLTSGGAGLAAAVIANQGNSVAGNMQVVMVFLVVIGFMIGSLIAASKMGAMGASFASNSASALVFGAAARGSNLVGGGAAYAARRRIQSSRLGNTMIGKAAVNRVLRPIEKGNADIRRAPGMGTALGYAGITAGAKPAEHATFGDTKHMYEDARDSKSRKALDRQYAGEVALQNLEKNAHDGKMDEKDEATLASLSTKELEALHGIQEGVKQLGQKLTPEQFENLMKSDKLDDSQKNALRDGRFSLLASQVASGNGGASIRKWSNKDLEQFGNSPAFAELLGDPAFAIEISDDQYDALMKSGKLTATQKASLEAARDERFSPERVAATIGGMNPEQIAKIKGSVLEKQHVYERLSLADFEKIREKGANLNANQRAVLGRHIESIARDPLNLDRAAYAAYLKTDPRVKSYWNIS